MKDVIEPHCILHRITAKTVLIFFLFTTFFSGIPGVPVVLPEAEASPGEITYITGYTYDNNGNVISKTAPTGKIIKYIYDGLNRLTDKCYVDDMATECTGLNAYTS